MYIILWWVVLYDFRVFWKVGMVMVVLIGYCYGLWVVRILLLIVIFNLIKFFIVVGGVCVFDFVINV